MKVTIAASDKTTSIQQAVGFTIGPVRMNERSTAHFQIVFAANYLPDRFAEVIAYEQDDTTPMWGGVILHRTVVSVRKGSKSMVVDVEVGDWWFYADVGEPFTRSYPGSTLALVILTDIIDVCLAPYGIAIWASFPVSGFVTDFACDGVRPSDALRMLANQLAVGGVSQRVYFDWSKHLKIYPAGTFAAPVTIEDAGANFEDAGWADSPAIPSNKIILWCGPEGVGDPIAFSWAGDGVTTIFSLAGVAIPASAVPPSVIVVDGVQYPLWPVGTGPADNIQFDYALDDGTVIFTGSSGPVGVGLIITLTYSPQFPFKVEDDTGASPVIVAPSFSEPNIMDYAAGVSRAAGLLEAANQDPRTLLAYRSETTGWDVAQAVTVDLDLGAYSIAGVFIVTEFTMRMESTDRWLTDIVAVETDRYQGGANDRWRQLGVGAGA